MSIDKDKLRSLLAGMHLPQWRLAKQLGYPPTTFSDYLRGARPAPDNLAKRIERALKLPTGTLGTDA